MKLIIIIKISCSILNKLLELKSIGLEFDLPLNKLEFNNEINYRISLEKNLFSPGSKELIDVTIITSLK